MLAPNASLQRIVVEGSAGDDPAYAGEKVIDLALYYRDTASGSERIAYRQFKHSIIVPPPDVTVSGLSETLTGFAARYSEMDGAAATCRFEFESNRSIAESAIKALENLKAGKACTDSNALRAKIALDPEMTKAFAKQVFMLTGTPDMGGQGQLLRDDTRAYLPGDDVNAPMRLVNLIANCAAVEDVSDRTITRHDVLSAMGCREADLRPAPSAFDLPDGVVPRPCIDELVARIAAARHPIILSAGGGVGKSVVTATLQNFLPEGSIYVSYDCFAQGSYRDPAKPRHHARQALVQIVNELAQRGLCDPLIPASAASIDDYHAAFTIRLEQAAGGLSRCSDALLVIVVDAADNAETIARDEGGARGLAAALLRSALPDRVRLVLTTRPERRDLLDPPRNTVDIILPEFSEEETFRHLTMHHPDATPLQANAFHRMSSANPRVQARLLEREPDLHTLLTRSRGPEALTVQGMIESLLDDAFGESHDHAGQDERKAMEHICMALSVLRPFIPVDILAGVSGTDPDLVRSVAGILGEALIVEDGMVQIADEPTETWLRRRFRPDSRAVRKIVAALRPHAEKDAYAAATLPRLMLEAGELDDLIALALSDSGLPPEGNLARRDIELMRLQTATRAALKAERHADAARLAFRAAGTVADESRRDGILSEHPDLAARFVDATTAQGYLADGRVQGGDWIGSDEAYEAAFYSGYSRFKGEAAVRLATANDWMHHHLLRRKHDGEDRFGISNADIVAMSWAVLELHGPRVLAQELARWTPRTLSFDIGLIIAERLADAGREDDLLALAQHAGTNTLLGLAITLATSRIGLTLPTCILLRWRRVLWDMRFALHKPYGRSSSYEKQDEALAAGVAFVEALAPHAPDLLPELVSYLSRILPRDSGRQMDRPGRDDAREAILRGHALHCALLRRPLTLDRFAAPGETIGPEHFGDHVTRMLHRDVSRLLPLYALWANAVFGRISPGDIEAALREARTASKPSPHTYIGEFDRVRDEQAFLGSEILFLCNAAPDAWKDALGEPEAPHHFSGGEPQSLRPSTVARVVRRMAMRADLHSDALTMAAQSRMCFEGEAVDVDEKMQILLALCRAVLRIDPVEAKALFEMAATVEGQYGEETLERWNALLGIVEAASRDAPDDPRLTYRLARLAEPVEHRVGAKYFDEDRTVRCLAALSPPSVPVILSRWADRGFSRTARNLGTALHALREAGYIDAITALLLYPAIGFDADEMLDAALTAGVPDPVIDDIVWRYIRPEAFDDYYTEKLRIIARRHGRSWVWLDTLPTSEPSDYSYRNDRRTTTKAALDALDLSEPDGMRQGFAVVWHGYEYDLLIERIPAGHETAFLLALVENVEIRRSDLEALAQAIPDAWKMRAAYPNAIRALAGAVLRRDPFTSDVSRLAKETGLQERDLILQALSSIAQGEGVPSYRALFTLVVLSCKATDAQGSRQVLSDILDDMESSLVPEDGDGPWQEALVPTGDPAMMLMAGLWAMLGTSDPSSRWMAIHAVRCLARWDSETLLGHLIDCATGKLSAPVHDARLSFYRLNALEGLLIALDRVAADAPGRVLVALPLLEAQTTPDRDHALIRGRAAAIRLTLHSSGTMTLPEAERRRLETVNHDQRKVELAPETSTGKRAEEKLYYPYDMRKELLRPIASVFSLSEDDAQQRCMAPMQALAEEDPHLNPKAEPRRDLPHFRHEQYRKQERRFNYLARHGTLSFLGRLLDGQEPSGKEKGYMSAAELLSMDMGMAAPGGRWRADRRGPVPAACRISEVSSRTEWLNDIVNIDPSDFGSISGETVLWGNWSATMSGSTRSVSVNSALVSRDTAPALMRALSCAKSSYDYAIPLAGHHGDILHPGFVMKGWVAAHEYHGGEDTHDPWAKQVPSGTLGPARWVRERLSLKTDPDGTHWTGPNCLTCLSLHCWSTKDRDDGGSDDGGQYLSAPPNFPRILATRTGMVLLREIIVRHRNDSGRSAWSEDDVRERVYFDLLGEDT